MTTQEYLKRKLREELEKEYQKGIDLLHEGLIKSQPLSNVETILNRFLNVNDEHNNHVIINHNDNTALVEIKHIANDLNYVKTILSRINALGYFPSMIRLNLKNNTINKDYQYDESYLFKLLPNFKDLDKLQLKIEAKFDQELSNIPKKLYHTTNMKHLKKILEIGLVPKAKSKEAQHPERIYFGLTYSDAYDMFGNFKKKKSDQKYVILEIDTNNLKNLRLFHDPNYKGYGVFTLMNIPHNSIKVIKENL